MYAGSLLDKLGKIKALKAEKIFVEKPLFFGRAGGYCIYTARCDDITRLLNSDKHD
jgi:hypothetical protein